MSKKESTKKKKTVVSKNKTSTKSKVKKTDYGIVNAKSTTSKFKQKELRSIYYKVYIGGVLLEQSRKECIEKLVITETVEGSDSCVLQISDPFMVYINDSIYQENKRVKVVMGWNGVSHKITFEGYISAIDIQFGSDGIPSLTITCMDNTYRMNKEKKTKTYKNKTSAQVVKSICKNYGFKCVIQSNYKFNKQDTISQSDQTDIEFITSLANGEIYPFTATLVGKTLYYVKMGKLSKTPIHSMTYREYPNDIISFSPQINTEVVEVTAGSTNTGSKKSNISSAKASGDNPSGTTSPSTKKASNSNSNNYKLNQSNGKWSKK